jgi:hypothetical protein
MTEKERGLAAIFFAIAIFLYALCSCKNPVYPETVVYTSEYTCQEVATRGRIRIDSFIMVRCQTTDTSVWRKCEDSIKSEIKRVMHELDTTGNNYYKYTNTQYTGKKIPCAIGDSVSIFHKLTPKG